VGAACAPRKRRCRRGQGHRSCALGEERPRAWRVISEALGVRSRALPARDRCVPDGQGEGGAWPEGDDAHDRAIEALSWGRGYLDRRYIMLYVGVAQSEILQRRWASWGAMRALRHTPGSARRRRLKEKGVLRCCGRRRCGTWCVRLRQVRELAGGEAPEVVSAGPRGRVRDRGALKKAQKARRRSPEGFF
jgi:hypothetical protein